MPRLFSWLRAKLPPGGAAVGEAWSGLAAMLVALPSAIAFGVAIYGALGPSMVARGATAGMLGVVAMGLVSSILGGAPRLISAPCAPAAAIMSALALELVNPQPGLGAGQAPERAMIFLMLVGLFCGILQTAYGLLGGGRLIKYIPYPVVSGYLSGVGILIILSQVPKLLGVSGGGSAIQALLDPTQWKWPGIVVGLVTVGGVAAGPRLTQKLPSPIVGVAAGLLAYAALAGFIPELRRLEGNSLLIGTVPAGGTSGGFLAGWSGVPLFPVHWGEIQILVVAAFMLSLLLSIDTLKTCVVLDAITRSRHHSNRELIAQGLGNVVSALVGGVPGAGTMGATLVNVSSGAQTRWSGVFEGAFALLTLLALSRVIGWLPMGALAGLLMVVATRMIDRKSFRLLKRRSTILDFVVTLAVIVVAVSWNLVAAAGVGLFLAILLFIREQMRGSIVRRKTSVASVSSKRQRTPEESALLQSQGQRITLCELQGSLFFGTTDHLFTELESDLKTRRAVILDLRRVQSVDYTAAHMLKQIEAMLASRQAPLVLSNLPPHLPTGQDLEEYFGEVGLVKPTRNVLVFATLDEALEWAEDLLIKEAATGAPDERHVLDLAEFDLFQGLGTDPVMEALRGCARERSAKPGETLFHAGDRSDEMFLVRRGLVRVTLPMEGGRRLTLTTVPRGHFFGDMAFLDRGVRSADAIAVEETELYVLSRERFNELTRSNPGACVRLFARLARILAMRLRQTDRELRGLMEA